MPETAIDEDRETLAGKRHIDTKSCGRHGSEVHAVPKTAIVQEPTDRGA